MRDDPVNHPRHYTQYSREVIELTERLSFCLGNACKYILRAPFKGNEKQDLQKSLWYVKRAMKNREIAGAAAKQIAIDFDNDLVSQIVEMSPELEGVADELEDRIDELEGLA
jgi:hypothetical protein